MRLLHPLSLLIQPRSLASTNPTSDCSDKYIHIYEKWSAVPNAIIFLILLGFAASSVTTSLAPASPAETGGILSFGAAVVGFSLGWASLGADCGLLDPFLVVAS